MSNDDTSVTPEADPDWRAEAKDLIDTKPIRRAQVIRAAVVLGAFDALDESFRSAESIADDLDPRRASQLL